MNPKILIASNVSKIKDIEVGHISMEYFLARIEVESLTLEMKRVIRSSIQKVATFPMST